MVIKYYISLLFLTFSISSFADAYHADFAEGNQAFKSKLFDQAIVFFNNEVQKNPKNVSAYFNLGLSYNAEKKYSSAIWAFEKVLKLTPNNGEAIDNIEQNYLELNNGSHWVSEVNYFERTLYGISSTTWALISVILSFLTAMLIIMFSKTSNVSRKRIIVFGSVTMIILMTGSIYVAWTDHDFECDHNYALITKDKIETYEGENLLNSEKTGEQLTAGTKVKKITMLKGDFLQVETSNGDSYFVKSTDVEFI